MAFNETGFDNSEKNLAHAQVCAELQTLLKQLEHEFELVSASRDEISKRIVSIKNTISGLNTLFGVSATEEQGQSHPPRRVAGLTNLCRRMLRNNSGPVTLVELIQRIQQDDPTKLANHQHPQNSLMVILKRLVDYGEIIEVKNDGSVRAWSVAGELHPTAVPPDDAHDDSLWNDPLDP